MSSSTCLILEWRPLRYRLAKPLKNAHGTTIEQRGWLLKLTNQAGDIGWGEVLPPLVQWHNCAAAIGRLGLQLELEQLELQLPLLPGALAFGLGLALAELQGLCEGWLEAPPSAWLLPAGAAAIPALENALNAAST
ncbi:o-succinylbenzoate synthase, partial [Synechococcus sp. Cruz CV12-2-Slac-r]|nr:o-succinylbenzoate synthase [Synechococcus sp. Cruz CV12-2-Slac-r]